ncbi:hypothetical protein QZH41_013148, partial [Actinostola sp. cb2023]
ITVTSLVCYSCNGYYESSSCTSTIDCSLYSFCYKKTADRVIGGQTARITVAGCKSSCTSVDTISECYKERNCKMSCCSTNNCNRVTVNDSLTP